MKEWAYVPERVHCRLGAVVSLQLRFLVGHHYCRKETTQAHNNVRVALAPKY